jgi:hypothetical protein
MIRGNFINHSIIDLLKLLSLDPCYDDSEHNIIAHYLKSNEVFTLLRPVN